jgi:uncharacterized BrkB/YihY/UPF0761 family membrane protein
MISGSVICLISGITFLAYSMERGSNYSWLDKHASHFIPHIVTSVLLILGGIIGLIVHLCLYIFA